MIASVSSNKQYHKQGGLCETYVAGLGESVDHGTEESASSKRHG